MMTNSQFCCCHSLTSEVFLLFPQKNDPEIWVNACRCIDLFLPDYSIQEGISPKNREEVSLNPIVSSVELARPKFDDHKTVIRGVRDWENNVSEEFY